MKTTYRAFSEDAVIDNIRHWVCILFVTALGSELSCPLITFFVSPSLSVLSFIPQILAASPLPDGSSVLFPLLLCCPNAYQSAYDKQMLTMQICLLKSLRPLSLAKQIHRNSALFPVTYFSIHAVFPVYKLISNISTCQED